MAFIFRKEFRTKALVRGWESLYWSGLVLMSRPLTDTGPGIDGSMVGRWAVRSHFKIKMPFGPEPRLLHCIDPLRHYILWSKSNLQEVDLWMPGNPHEYWVCGR